ncbi:MAG TPA: protein-tyrosine-phosphatase [Alphaproteobacteria bacterium]|nr:protein-tyrosine-phosphatase [Alphaproteobacteria bacterium]
MNTDIVPFRLTICGLDELGGHCATGVSHVLSILDPGHPEPVAFGGYGEHERLELRFHDIIDPRPGMILPQPGDVEQVLEFGRNLMTEPAATRHLLVHCHAGVSRSTASMGLILAQARPDLPAAAVWQAVRTIRPIAWPSLRIVELGDELLGRAGALVTTLRDLYRARLADEPGWADDLRLWGRGRELAGL